MYNVMIVEDELLIKAGIKSLIDWDKLGLNLVADASDGAEALEIYESNKPDLIITDIRMPRMDGLELIKRIREKDERVRFVILTCHEEFDVAREALRLGVDGYILKLTMNQEEMEDILSKSIKKLKQFVNTRSSDETNIRNNMETTKNELFCDYVLYERITYEQFKRGFDELDLKYDGKKVVLALMEIDKYDEFILNNGAKKDISVKKIIQNIISGVAKKSKIQTIIISDSRCVLVFEFEKFISEQNIMGKVFDILTGMKNLLRRYFELSASFGLSCIYDDVSRIKEMYNKSVMALNFSFFNGRGTINNFNGYDRKKIIKKKLQKFYTIPKYLDNLICLNEYNNRVEEFLSLPDFSENNVRDFFLHLLQMVAMNVVMSKNIVEDCAIKYTNFMYKCETYDEMYAVFEDFLKEVNIRQKEGVSYSSGIEEAIRYIRHHFSEELSLNHVAEHVNLSPNYFSSLFKKELNVNFVEYLTNYRIEKAKPLLLETRLLSYEISQRVGFIDGAYFSRTFKKITGYSPNEYRKILLK